jgi:hypothetical protein
MMDKITAQQLFLSYAEFQKPLEKFMNQTYVIWFLVFLITYSSIYSMYYLWEQANEN